MVIKSKHIMTELLREEMGFEGMVVSDYMSINKAVDLGVSENPVIGGIQALEAGLDVEMPNPYAYTQELIDAVKKGELEENLIDRALRRILTLKFALGLFENPYPREEITEEAFDSKTTHEHSLKAAHESIVLVKNDGLLPLKKDIKKIAVIGPHADSIRLLFGGYTYPAMLDMMISGSFSEMAGVGDAEDSEVTQSTSKAPFYPGSIVRQENTNVTGVLAQIYGQKTPTILTSIKEKCQDTQVVYEKGCGIAGTDKDGFEAAVAAAKEADVVILTSCDSCKKCRTDTDLCNA